MCSHSNFQVTKSKMGKPYAKCNDCNGYAFPPDYSEWKPPSKTVTSNSSSSNSKSYTPTPVQNISNKRPYEENSSDRLQKELREKLSHIPYARNGDVFVMTATEMNKLINTVVKHTLNNNSSPCAKKSKPNPPQEDEKDIIDE